MVSPSHTIKRIGAMDTLDPNDTDLIKLIPHARRTPLPAGMQVRTMKMGFHCSLGCIGIGGFATLNSPYLWFRFIFCFVNCAMRYALCAMRFSK